MATTTSDGSVNNKGGINKIILDGVDVTSNIQKIKADKQNNIYVESNANPNN
ncbi:hypothetical protein [Paraclostridium dentum]|uniref:hypothetical protein n=1 Tax=Paraclostridium dentum TaxID=2662455 RepID=UPI003F66ADC0